MAYAEGTKVASDRSRAEIEKTLQRYGASHFGYMSAPGAAAIAFQIDRYQVKLAVPIPLKESFKYSANGRPRTQTQIHEARAKEERRRWRALALCVKAKLEAVESGITTLEQEFMAHIILPGSGMTVGESLLPRINEAVESGNGSLMLEWNP